ncbi:MAG TPA: EAL domain-containing protein [Gaiellaceae bacterium]|nr:EAL domain-containing protein [Gaiellaceae bacterium]
MVEHSGSSSEPVSSVRSRRTYVWVAVAAVLAVGGTTGALLGAHKLARHDAEESRQALASSADRVASTLQLAIRREEDLVVAASAFLLSNPNGSNAELARWARLARVLERYPQLKVVGSAVVVPASELAAFTQRAAADPAGGQELGADGRLAIIPPGNRPFYCLQQRAVFFEAAMRGPAGFDLCAIGLGALLLAARDSGRGTYLPLPIGDDAWLAVQTPIYAGGGVPATVAARRATFAGWVGTVTDPQVILLRALQGYPGLAVSLRYHPDSSSVAFLGGSAPDGAQSVTVDLQNGWTATTFGAVASSGVLTNGSAAGVLVAGVALSLLLAALVFVLATGRARALRVVGERTGQLRHQSLHDALTGLPNRTLIMDRIDQLLARNRRNGTQGAALFIDLDEFKNINDSMGHEAGDQLLVAVAARLKSTLRDADTVGRMGGDEFVILIDGGEPTIAPELVAERLLDVMRQPFEVEGAAMPLIVNTSIGIAIGDRDSGGELLRDADVALYQAKAAGKNRYEIFFPAMQTEILDRMAVEFDLRSALDSDEFRLHYQPIYNLDDLTLVGVEALLRWQHPSRGLVQPDEFISILEQTGQIREVGRWVLREACEQMAAWHARGDTLDLSVNISGRQLDSDDILDHVREALYESGLVATSLIIEVTETALMRNPAATAERLQAIKELGVRIAVDDFGTGYSSLAYLQQFPVDCLKIDRTFTNAITTSPESKALIGTLVQLGKDLGLTTLAEGVEDSTQIDHLRDEHVNEAQGFLLSRPLDPETLEAQLLAPTRPPLESSNPT